MKQRGYDPYKDKTFEYNAASDTFTCLACNKPRIAPATVRSHRKTSQCLDIVIENVHEKITTGSSVDPIHIQVEPELAAAPSFGREFIINFIDTDIWSSEPFVAFGHTWQFAAERKYNRTFVYLKYIPMSNIEYDIHFNLDIKVNDKIHEFNDLNINTIEDEDIYVKFDEYFDSFEFDLIKLSIRKIQRKNAEEDYEATEFRSKRLETLHAKYINKHARLLDQWLCKWQINRQAALELSQIHHTPGWEPTMTPPTPHIYDQIRPHFFRAFKMKKLIYNVDGVDFELPYNTIESILEHVLETPKYMKGWHYKSQNKDPNHPSSRQAFKIYEEEHKARIAADYQLVLPYVWIDHFVGQESRNNSFGSVMVSFVNFSTEVLMTQESRFLVTTIPPNLKEFQDDIIDKIIVDFCVQLEEGTLDPKKFPMSPQPSRVCGGLYCVKADHVEKVGLAGVVASGGNVPSVYTTTPRDRITVVNYERTFRDPMKSKEKIDNWSTLPKSKQKAATYSSGLNGKKSPFWRLKIFSKDFYMRFAICSLHLLHLGIVKKYTQEVSNLFHVAKKKKPSDNDEDDKKKKKKKKKKKTTPKYQKEINERVRQLPSAHHITKITMPIFNKENNTAGLTGRMWSTWTRVATGLNADLLKADNLQQLSVVMDGIRTIEEVIWTDELLDSGLLDDMVKEIVSAILQTSRDVPEDVRTDWNIPNIETLFALSQSIKFLGQLWFQSTDLDEGTNKFHRKCIKVTNHKKIAPHLLKMVAKQRSIDCQVFKTPEEKREFEKFSNYHKKEKKIRKFLDGLNPTCKEIDDEEYVQVRRALSALNTDNITYKLKSKQSVHYLSVFIKERKVVLKDKPTMIYKTHDGFEHHGELQNVFEMDVLVTENETTETKKMKFFTIQVVKCIEDSPLQQKPFEYIDVDWITLPILDEKCFVCMTAKIKDYSNANRFFLV